MLMALATSTLEQIADLYERGLYLQAYQCSQELGPLASWQGTPERVLAGRLAGNLGGFRLASALHFRAWRADRSDPEACYFRVHALLSRGRLLEAQQALLQYRDERATAITRADCYALSAQLAAFFRDFATAHECIQQAQALAPDHAWVWIERAIVLEREDRQEESLEAAEHALALRPWYRPGVQAVSRALQLLNRDRQALDLLLEACERLESGELVRELAELQRELGMHADARRSYDRLPELLPLADKHYRAFIAGRRSDAAYDCQDFDEAQALARDSGSEFHKKVAEHLAAATEADTRAVLPVGFVRQHHVTCAPATLTAISSYWSLPADHLQIAEKICYDGTPAHSERGWAEQQGFLAREFTVTWAAAKALIDRGIPFTLTTVEPTSAHLQAAIGYDSRRRTLQIRDPSQRQTGEFLADAFLERYQSTGPRGMLLVPAAEGHRLDGIELPDAELYDLLHRLQSSLDRHDRLEAVAAHDAMRTAAPYHRLTLHGRRTLAGYDDDPAGGLHACEQMLAQFPDDASLQLTKLSCRRELARRDERLAQLEAISNQPGADPVFWLRRADELIEDAREHPTARRLLERYLRRRPDDALGYLLLANICWSGRQFDKAWELYRIAACLNDKEERYARAFFTASRWLKATEQALNTLRDRFVRFGRKSSQPARTLFWAYADLDRIDEGFEVLREAISARPDDVHLQLFSAEEHGRYGRFAEANSLLARAKGRSHMVYWNRTAATLAWFQGDSSAALTHWHNVLDQEPTASDAHSAVTQLLAAGQGREAALAHLQQAVERFPHNMPLLRLQIELLREDDRAAVEQAIRKLLDVSPVDAWARRELVLALAAQQRTDEALAEAELAMTLEPSNPYSYTVQAHAFERAGRIADAKEAYRSALRLSIDNEAGIAGLMWLCDTNDQRRAELKFVHSELVRQTTFGSAVGAYRSHARDVLNPQAVLTTLREALDQRPDLWPCWSSVVQQLLDMERVDEAKEMAQRAAARFPVVPGAWLDVAAAARAARDEPAELDALEHALRINPGWAAVIQDLAAFHQRRQDFAAARELLERAIARAPLDPTLHGFLADTLWQSNQPGEAIAQLETAVRVDPGYNWAWDMLQVWGPEAGQPDAAIRAARDLAARRPSDARTWLIVARMLGGSEIDERLSAARKAAELNPRLVEAYKLQIATLVDAERYDEALEACRPAVFGTETPLELRAHAAWIESRRGELERAIEQMRVLLQEDPEYYAGWKLMAEWLLNTGDTQALVEAAEKLVQLAPRDPEAWGFAGDARARAKDVTGAKEALRRALTLSPTYEFAANVLFDLHMEENDLDAAEQTLQIVFTGRQPEENAAASTPRPEPPRAVSEFIIARSVQLACRRSEINKAADGLRQLCQHPSPQPWPLSAAVYAMLEKQWFKAVERELLAALAQPEVDPQVAECWVDTCARQAAWRRCRNQLHRLRDKGECWLRASARFLEAAGEARATSEVARYVREYRRALAADDGAWASAGSALTQIDQHKHAVRWLSDWRQRANLTPWSLFFLGLSLRCRGREAAAIEVHRHALTLPPDHTTPMHVLWLASSEMLAGDLPRARELLTSVTPDGLTDFYQTLEALVREGLELLDWPSSAGRLTYKTARRRLLSRLSRHRAQISREPMLHSLYHRLMRRIAVSSSSYAAAGWHWLGGLSPL
jgi:tetratricopeptide (TPR) repeat protein